MVLKTDKKVHNMASVCIVVDHNNGELKKATLQAITFGHEAAAKIGAELHLIVIGSDMTAVADGLKSYGAVKIHVADDPGLQNYQAETWGHIAAEIAKANSACLVGMNVGTTGKDLMPRVAGKLNAGMASGILSFDGTYFTREMWAGNALATVEIMTDIKVVTIQSTVFDPAETTTDESAVAPVNVTLPPCQTRFIERREVKSDRPDLTEAEVVVSGGRGLKVAENFKLIEELADLFGAAVGATRAAVDNGWVSNDLQVGQTGKVVAPSLYFAIGLSGAMQHLAGMKSSKVIVAINKDEEAPIFQVADFGLVADLFKVLPELTELLRKEIKG
jgi:electron transfer flavoprotein alpha subunit